MIPVQFRKGGQISYTNFCSRNFQLTNIHENDIFLHFLNNFNKILE